MLLAGPIFHTSTQYIDFVDFLHFNECLPIILLILVGVELPLHVVVTILECCVTFSEVKLSIRSFVLFSKYQSGFRKSKSTNDHLFRLSQTIMESFNRGEHVIAAFLDVEKAFNNVWHNGLRYKIYQLDLPTKLCRWLSDFLVGRVIQVKVEGFLSPKFTQKQVFHKVQT